ncbi:cold shock domain-containing protein [Mycoplasma iguanae]|uniref:Cold shock domain-containing protein n=1 Tax=Mycoplasma iguanae TaxID=292461 RepID=A0ABY5RB92_9MOLU|nr:cold shock domain-containing protein [Mycoplasma iguanae]
MTQGKVKWFNETKGYGFIADQHGEDIFFHYSNLEVQGFKTIEKDTNVEFEISNKGDKKQALKIRPI